jgi:NAD-dependent dihydropyrimidine dehydrogenase PreA subunit
MILAVLGIAALVHKPHAPRYPGDYADVAPPIAAQFRFQPEQVKVFLPPGSNLTHYIVFAYDDSSTLYGIMAPASGGCVVIRNGDCADFRVWARNDTIKDYTLLKQVTQYTLAVDMAALLRRADTTHHKLGVQRCLFPMCTICLDICRRVKGSEKIALTIHTAENGELVPVYLRGECPRCGECYVECPVGALLKSDKMGK